MNFSVRFVAYREVEPTLRTEISVCQQQKNQMHTYFEIYASK